MPAWLSSPIVPVLAHLAIVADSDTLSDSGLMAALARVPDPRERRGVRHGVTAVLAVAACAVLAGCRSFTAIGESAAIASDRQEAGSWLVSKAGEAEGTKLCGAALVALENVAAVEVDNFDGTRLVSVSI